ncbi:light-regulated signal transduction histidine kinase (bacteriophytochrome) [Filimonas zeae]|nr:GAF domain-containing protein [Filimonas zeae]MDR6340715.1 light-regulated signal transduction histidine kinase (bacteriophytochrome) [Filimonas zeae]
MNIRDIVNRDNINLQNCESEPIHIPGCIQEHGFLLGVHSTALQITYCSANTERFTGHTPEAMLGKGFEEVFSSAAAAQLQAFVNNPRYDQSQPLVFTINHIQYNTQPHLSGDVIVLEFEPFPDGSLALPDLYRQTQKLVTYLQNAENLRQLSHSIAAETRTITGYDRVMIYRFDKDYNGEVFAESKRDDLLPLLGHNYPHTDIPAQARELYLKNMLRMIADVDYTPVPILTRATDATHASLDLSYSVLRSVSPIHIEYLKNMGVKATLTISLIQDGRLWGMIACHHYSPLNIPHFTRLSALLQGYFFTSQIKVRELADQYEQSKEINDCMQQLLEALSADENFILHQHHNPDLYTCINAGGIAIQHGNHLYTGGLVPDEAAIQQLATWLKIHAPQGRYSTDRLIEAYPAAQHLSHAAAGIIYHELSAQADSYVIWFRPEMVKAINWAGNPSKGIVMDSNGARLSPRKSFELWKEEVKNQSMEWTRPERDAAAQLAYNLQKQVYLLRIRQEEERYRRLTIQLQAANAELENFNWISAHDLKEPLRKIQVFASRTFYGETSLEVYKDSLLRIQNSAHRIQLLLDSMLSFADMRSSGEVRDTISVQQLLQQTIDKFTGQIAETNATIILPENLPALYVIPRQAEQLFTHLISNALKFRKPAVAPQLVIDYRQNPAPPHKANGSTALTYHTFSFADNGTGFDNRFTETIFRIFQILNRTQDYTNVGIGLAICKKIMDNHEGFITASSCEGEGSVFKVYFPA